MTCLNFNCRILPTFCPLKYTANGSAQVLLHIYMIQAVFLWVALDLHHSVDRDLSRGFVRIPWAGKRSFPSRWYAHRVGNSLEAHSIFTCLGFHSLWCSWVLTPMKDFFGSVGGGVGSWSNLPPSSPSQVPPPPFWFELVLLIIVAETATSA